MSIGFTKKNCEKFQTIVYVILSGVLFYDKLNFKVKIGANETDA